MAKKKQVEDEVIEVEDAPRHTKVPSDYHRRKGDQFIPYDPTSEKEEVDLEHYYVYAEEPSETDLGEVLVVGVSVWYNLATGEVFVFKGKDSNGKNMWERSFTQPRWVLETEEGDAKGTILGKLVNRHDARLAQAQELTKKKMEELEPTTANGERPTLGDVLDSLDETGEDVPDSDTGDDGLPL